MMSCLKSNDSDSNYILWGSSGIGNNYFFGGSSGSDYFSKSSGPNSDIIPMLYIGSILHLHITYVMQRRGLNIQIS